MSLNARPALHMTCCVSCPDPIPSPNTSPLKHRLEARLISVLCVCRLPLHCRGFCQRVVHPDSHFFDKYHQHRGDKEIAVSPWQAHPVIGEVRELKFISPVSVRFLLRRRLRLRSTMIDTTR